MDVRDLDRIGFVTRHFKDLQGLRLLVPMGMMYTMQALTPLLDRLPAALWIAFMAINFAGAMLLMFASKRYYRRLLGEVEVRNEITLSMWLPALVLVAAVLLYLVATGSLSPLRVVCVIYGSCLVGFWLGRECRWSQGYHLLLGGLLLAVALFGLRGSAAAQREIAYGVSGASWILAGLLDHRQLVRALGQLPEPSGEPAAGAEPAGVEESR